MTEGTIGWDQHCTHSDGRCKSLGLKVLTVEVASPWLSGIKKNMHSKTEKNPSNCNWSVNAPYSPFSENAQHMTPGGDLLLIVLLQISNHKRQMEQLRSDLQLTKSLHLEEVGRYQQDIQLLKEDLELTKNDLEEAQAQATDSKVEATRCRDELEKEHQLHEEAVAEVNRRGDELQAQDRQWSECRQQVIVLEGQLEQSQEAVQRLESGLDGYKQKFQQSTEQIVQLEDSLTQTQEQLTESRTKVSVDAGSVWNGVTSKTHRGLWEWYCSFGVAFPGEGS